MLALVQEVKFTAHSLAEALRVRRNCVQQNPQTGELSYDPRFLAFEFINNIVLRKQQCQLVVRFLHTVETGKSLCHQLIMGAGKTTVVGPLLALILADGKRLLTQVCLDSVDFFDLFFFV